MLRYHELKPQRLLRWWDSRPKLGRGGSAGDKISGYYRSGAKVTRDTPPCSLVNLCSYPAVDVINCWLEDKDGAPPWQIFATCLPTRIISQGE